MRVHKPAVEFNAIVLHVDHDEKGFDWVSIQGPTSGKIEFTAQPGRFRPGQTVPVQIGIIDDLVYC